MSTLYILGNGFDRAHKLNTDYKDFIKHLRDTKGGPELLDNLSLFNTSIRKELEKQEDWCHFEDDFACLDLDRVKSMSSLYGRTGEEIVTTIFNKTKAELRSFIIESYKEKAIKPIYDLPTENALFVTFNYTHTLEDVYGIPKRRILHIHGDAERKEAFSLFGLSKDEREIVFGGPKDNAINLPEGPIRETLIKDTDKLAKDLDAFLSHHPEDQITRIVVLGSSISKADLPYFYHLLERYPGCPWVINIFPEDTSGAYRRAEELRRVAKPGTIEINCKKEPSL